MKYVLDTSAILSGKDLYFEGDLFIPDAVEKEVSSSQSRKKLGYIMDRGLRVLTPDRAALDEVVTSAERTGDLLRLSQTDMEVIALALQLDPSVRAAGSVREIAPQADPTTRTLRVRVTLDKPPASFRLGTTVTAAVAVEARSGIELPASALLEQDGRTLVWIVDPASLTVSTREVGVAEREGSAIRVVEGIEPGTRVVTAGVHSLTPGQPVKIEDETP